MSANPPTIPEEDFARLRLRLSQLHAERGLTYHDLAAQAEVSRSMLIALRRGRPAREASGECRAVSQCGTGLRLRSVSR